MPLIERPGLDLWTYWEYGGNILIPTNIGWKANGAAVMGRGLAERAVDHYPELAEHYGQVCRKYAAGELPNAVAVYRDFRLVLAPSKGLNRRKPHLSWQYPASLRLVQKSLRIVKNTLEQGVIDDLCIPLMGTGNGGLPHQEVYWETVAVLCDCTVPVTLSTPFFYEVEEEEEEEEDPRTTPSDGDQGNPERYA